MISFKLYKSHWRWNFDVLWRFCDSKRCMMGNAYEMGSRDARETESKQYDLCYWRHILRIFIL